MVGAYRGRECGSIIRPPDLTGSRILFIQLNIVLCERPVQPSSSGAPHKNARKTSWQRYSVAQLLNLNNITPLPSRFRWSMRIMALSPLDGKQRTKIALFLEIAVRTRHSCPYLGRRDGDLDTCIRNCPELVRRYNVASACPFKLQSVRGPRHRSESADSLAGGLLGARRQTRQ
jgi:hypothetical protein